MQELALEFGGKKEGQPRSHLQGLIRAAREAAYGQTPGIPPVLLAVARVCTQESTLQTSQLQSCCSLAPASAGALRSKTTVVPRLFLPRIMATIII